MRIRVIFTWSKPHYGGERRILAQVFAITIALNSYSW